MGNEILTYKPDFVTPPGETLRDALEERGMTQASLADRTGHSAKLINEIIKGDAALTPQTALQFERVLGIPAAFWNNREARYREFLAREEEAAQLFKKLEWMQAFPLAAMSKKGWFSKNKNPIEEFRGLLDFFAVVSPDQWREVWCGEKAFFRKTQAFASDPYSVAAWLRRGELQAVEIRCAPFVEANFRLSLREARGATRDPFQEAFPRIQQACAAAGVAVVITPELPGSRASGATRWLSPEKALIQLSLRHKTDDHFWFTFFHEAGHVLLHGKRDAFLEGGPNPGEDRKEREADAFAQDILIPKACLAFFKQSQQKGRVSRSAILAFASEQEIAPGIVAGRLQHDGFMPVQNCNDLKRKIKWIE